MRPSRTSVLALTGLLAASPGWAQETPPSPEAKAATQPVEADDPSKPVAFREEVLVTAQKRTEAIQDIPASVTVCHTLVTV